MAQAPRTQESGGWQSAIDWQAFFTEANNPAIGYDPLNDKVIVKQSTDYSNSTSQDVYMYDMRTGAWSKAISALSGSTDVTNFVVNGSGELVCKASHSSTSAFHKWDSSAKATSSFQWTSKAYDFGYPGAKKKLYKVIIHAKNGDNMVVKAGYDNAAVSNVFTSNTIATGSSITKNTLVVTTPTAFSYFTLQIESNGTSNAGFEINDIAFIYRAIKAH